MGGSSYDVPVGTASPGRTYSGSSAKTYSKVRGAHQTATPGKKTKFVTEVKNPIVVALDVTGSMGDSARIMYDKMPMFWGQLEQQGYLKDMAISFCCVGDVHSDQAPLQVTPFEQAKAIHPWLEKLWLEGGGGGTCQESYDGAAAFYLNQVEMPKAERAFFFFIGDEGFYDTTGGFPNAEVFKQLMVKYDVFFIHWPYCGGCDPVADKKIVAQWRDILGERLLILKDPKAIVDVMLGLVAMRQEARSLDDYVKDMKARGQSDERVATVTDTITTCLGATPAPKKKKAKKDA